LRGASILQQFKESSER